MSSAQALRTVPTVTFESRTTGHASLQGGIWQTNCPSVCGFRGYNLVTRFCHLGALVCLSWAGLEKVRRTTIRLAPLGAIPERPPLKNELKSGHFFFQQACVEYLLCARFSQALQTMPSSIVWSMRSGVWYCWLLGYTI